MNNQIFIQQMLHSNQILKNTKNKMEQVALKKYQIDLFNLYNHTINEECHHDYFNHNDYFLESELKECEKEKAGFRLITCATCGKQVWLVKTKNSHWDQKIGERRIIVLEKQKVKKMP